MGMKRQQVGDDQLPLFEGVGSSCHGAGGEGGTQAPRARRRNRPRRWTQHES